MPKLSDYIPGLLGGEVDIDVGVDLGDIVDSNLNELLEFDSVASAVNNLRITNSITGNPVLVQSVGGDTNIGLDIDGKGSGAIRLNQTGTGNITTPRGILSSSASAGIGYSTGAGGAVTQATNRTTGVTLNTITGTITTNTASLAAEASADFVVTNSRVAIGDTVVLSMQSGSNGGGTLLEVITVAAGSFTIRVHNGNVAAGTAETGAILINFAVIKAVSA